MVLVLFGFSHASAADIILPGATTAELSGPYEDRRQAEVTFGQRSYYLAPWRAYMDTWPAQRYRDCLGVSFNANQQQEDALAQVLAEAGFHQVRVEWGWGKVAWDGKQMKDAAGLVTQMQTMRRHGLRPLILLNGHHGAPCPTRDIAAVLKADAKQGDREIILADTTQVRPGYCGFSSLTDYKAGYPLIDHVDAASGRCVLSAPLPKDLKAGGITLIELRYRPFSGATFKDGQVNPACVETLQGWMDYVAAVTSTAKAGLGTEKATDAGFDLEVWNELTFGSNFLSIDNYCDPHPEYATPISYRQHGREAKGVEAILPMTVDWVADPANRCPRVKVISGFSNQRPWDSGTQMWPGQAGFSRHYYTGLKPLRLDPQNVDRPDSRPLNALGVADGKPDGKEWHGAIPGSFFVPVHSVAMPEWWFYGYKTEFITRDIQPFPSTSSGPVSFADHHRFSHPGTGRPAEVWETETNLDRSDFTDVLMKAAKCPKEDPRLATILHEIGARGLLRQTLFSVHKGIATMTVFSTNGGDTYLGVLPDAFFTLLTADGGKLTDRVRAAAGPQLAVIGRVTKRLSGGEPIDVAR